MYEINLSKKEKLADLVLTPKGNTKKLYQIVSKLTGSVKDNKLPKAGNDKKLANDFFLQKIKKIEMIRIISQTIIKNIWKWKYLH